MVQRVTEVSGKPIAKKKLPIIALIDEAVCTGCEVCIEFCPVDCILLAANPDPELTNNVCRVVEDDCLGCKICVRECPWECIDMVPRKSINDEIVR